MPLHAPPFFRATYTFSALSLTSLSAFMLFTPNLYHKHIIRSSLSSTSDLLTHTQFTPATTEILYDTIRVGGFSLAAVGSYLLVVPHGNRHPSIYGLAATTSVAVIVGHLWLLKDVISTPIIRKNWLKEPERVVKVAVVLGVNALTAVICAWASFGGWPWTRTNKFFGGAAGGTGGRGMSYNPGNGDADLDIEGVVNGVVSGVFELAGGLTGLAKGFLGVGGA